MYKMQALIGLTALAALVGAPMGAAHMDTSEWSLRDEVNTVAAPDLPTTTTTGDANRVSGVYYGSLSALIEHTGVEVTPGNSTSFAFGAAFGLCDMEVLSSGDFYGVGFDATAGELGDEPEIDGNTNTGANGAANQGTLFNDGGVTAVCHTPAGYYGEDDFNTAKCMSYDPASADDAVSARVWISTACSYAYTTDGVGLLDYFVDCVSGAVLTVNTGELLTCVSTTVGCVTGSGGCGVLAAGWECGPNADGVADIQVGGESGWGDSASGVAFPQSGFLDEDGVDPVTGEEGCDGDAHANAAVFVWNAVIIDSTGAPDLGDSGVSVATVGVIQ